MKTLTIVWQRLVEDGKTCPRCNTTEKEVDDAIVILKKMLEPKGIQVVLEKRAIPLSNFAKNPLESNRIFINDRPLEEWLKGDVGESPCGDVCGPVLCRTLKLLDKIYESIPAELLVQAGLKAAGEITG